MPKVSNDSTDSPKKVTRKRAVKSVVSNTEDTVITPPRVRSEKVEQIERKAPARISLSEDKPSSKKRYVKVFVTMFILFVASIWIGVSDGGQIDVSARINERNNKIINGDTTNESGSGDSQNIVVPVQNTSPSIPNAGLRGRGIGTVNVPDVTQEVVATTSSSSESIETSPEASTGSTTVESGNGEVSDSQPVQ